MEDLDRLNSKQLNDRLADLGHVTRIKSAGGPRPDGGFDGITVACSCDDEREWRGATAEYGLYPKLLRLHLRQVLACDPLEGVSRET